MTTLSLPTSAPGLLSSAIVMGINDHRHCISGWHALQVDGRNGVRFRWTAAEATFRILLPAGARELRLFLSGPSALTARPASLTLYSGTTRLAHLPTAASTDFWTTVSVSLSGSSTLPAPAEFTIRSERLAADGSFRLQTFTFDHYLHNGDHRPLGLMIGAIRAF